ncbi:MAG: alpha-amylase family glycosyl hydrolase [Acidimicrobiia bacterium]
MTTTSRYPIPDTRSAGEAGHWWDEAVGYEVYVRSFADSNGDGIGDLAGIAERLPHLADLGVDVIWLTPFYPSPQADFGYDVADHTDVDPTHGTLADFDELLARAHDLGLRVMVDLVPNHTSSEHRWFRSALGEGVDSPFRDHYVWRDPAPDGGPPNNWFSIFGGRAWTFDEASGQYYMHLFLPEQPDLNWAEPAVGEAFTEILRFWLARGVDGFRIDVAHSLTEDPSFADNPPSPDLPPGTEPTEFDHLDHVHDLDQASNVDVYRSWRPIADEADALLLGEVYLAEPERVWRYVDDGALHRAFFFGLNRRDWDPVAFAADLRHAAAVIPQGWAWVQGSHDESRNVSRFGGGDLGVERALALWVAMFGLPGTPVLYQGEELGLPDGEVAPEDRLDPVAAVRPDDARDPARTPMPWTTGRHHGFTTGEPWLRSAPRPPGETLEHQARDAGSPYRRMRDLLWARRRTRVGRRGAVRWWPAPPGVVAYARDGVAHAANLTDVPVTVAPRGSWVVDHAVGEVTLDDAGLRLGPRAGAILEGA